MLRRSVPRRDPQVLPGPAVQVGAHRTTVRGPECSSTTAVLGAVVPGPKMPGLLGVVVAM